MRKSIGSIISEYDREHATLLKQLEKAGNIITSVAQALGASDSSRETIVSKARLLVGSISINNKLMGEIEKVFQAQRDELAMLRIKVTRASNEDKKVIRKNSRVKKSGQK